MKVSEEKEMIKHAAIIADNGWIFIGKSHDQCFRKMRSVGVQHFHRAEGQGFVTNKGRFVFRDRAARIAIDASQIDIETGYLFSEDLWSEHCNGKCDYSELHGYTLKTTN